MDTQVFSICSKLSLVTSRLLERLTPFKLDWYHCTHSFWSLPPLGLCSWWFLSLESSPLTFSEHWLSFQGAFKMLPLDANLWHCSRFLFIQLQVDALFSFSSVNFYGNYVCFFILFIMFFLTGEVFLNGEAQFSSYCSHGKRLPSFSAQPSRHISLLPCKLLITRVANYGSSLKIQKDLFFSSVKHFPFILSRNYHHSFIPHFLPGTYCY